MSCLKRGPGLCGCAGSCDAPIAPAYLSRRIGPCHASSSCLHSSGDNGPAYPELAVTRPLEETLKIEGPVRPRRWNAACVLLDEELCRSRWCRLPGETAFPSLRQPTAFRSILSPDALACRWRRVARGLRRAGRAEGEARAAWAGFGEARMRPRGSTSAETEAPYEILGLRTETAERPRSSPSVKDGKIAPAGRG